MNKIDTEVFVFDTNLASGNKGDFRAFFFVGSRNALRRSAVEFVIQLPPLPRAPVSNMTVAVWLLIITSWKIANLLYPGKRIFVSGTKSGGVSSSSSVFVPSSVYHDVIIHMSKSASESDADSDESASILLIMGDLCFFLSFNFLR